jgi:hypothetical protein
VPSKVLRLGSCSSHAMRSIAEPPVSQGPIGKAAPATHQCGVEKVRAWFSYGASSKEEED